MAEFDLRKLQRDIDGLCEANRRDYHDLAEKRHTGSEKAKILDGITLRAAELLELLRKKWATQAEVDSEVEKGRLGMHISGITNAYVPMPLVEVTLPDGRPELWAVAAHPDDALSIVKDLVPVGSFIKPSERLFPFRKMDVFRSGEARRVEP